MLAEAIRGADSFFSLVYLSYFFQGSKLQNCRSHLMLDSLLFCLMYNARVVHYGIILGNLGLLLWDGENGPCTSKY